MLQIVEAKLVEVKVDSSSLHRSSTGSITGGIWLDISSRAFPAPKWNDFVVLILEEWLSTSVNLYDGSAKFGRCRFMDGDHWFEIERRRTDVWSLRCSGGVDTAEIEPRTFMSSMVSCANEIFAACTKQGWHDDVRGLESAAWHGGRRILAHHA